MDSNFVKVGKWGGCLWGITERGELYINEGVAAGTDTEGSPWASVAAGISAVYVLGKVTFADGTSLAGLFKGCRRMQKADLSGFITDNVSDMSSMFEGCAVLKELDISSFNTFGCSNMNRMFAQCAELNDILMGEGFSKNGDGTTNCGKLAVKNYGKYKKAKIISPEGFSVFYHSNYDHDQVEERHTIPGYSYTIESPMFDLPGERSAFVAWNTDSKGKGVYFPSGKSFDNLDRDLHLYAQWAWAPEVANITAPRPFSFGETIPFELPEIISVNDPEVTGYLEISRTGEEGSWHPIDHNVILPAVCNGCLIRLHVSNRVGETLTNAVPLDIRKANIDTSAVRWAEDDDMTYDGTPKHVWLEGLPEGVTVKYSGNEATEAGIYTASISLDFDRDNYNEPPLVREYEWTIRKASFDMSQAHWDYSAPFRYDGTEKAVNLFGLPEGVTARIAGNTASGAGVYTARAKLVFDEVNFEKPQDIMPCIWEIQKVAVDPSTLIWRRSGGTVYDGMPKRVYVVNLPDDAVSHYEGAEETLAGKYLARVTLSENYRLTGPAGHEWEIDKASYDMSAAKWSDTKDFVFDGAYHSIELESVPADLRVKYSGNIEKSAGSYIARASFINSDTHNYNTPGDMTARWSIGKKPVDMSQVRWNYSGAFIYDGERKKVELIGLPEGVHADYENAAAYDAGVYNAHAVLRYDEDNTTAIEPADCQWKILKRRIDISAVCWDYSEPFEYDGKEHSVYLANVPDGLDVEYSGNAKVESGKYAASATLIPTDSHNYETPEINGCTWAINKAELSIPEPAWTDFSGFVYDGSEKKVEIISDLGEALRIEYTGNTERSAGRYYAKAIFSPVDDTNYRAPKPVGMSWSIAKAKFDMSGVYWDYDEPFVFDGNEKRVSLAGVPEGVSVEYSNASASRAGTYVATARFKVKDDSNYEDDIPEMTLGWNIRKSTFDMSEVRWQSERRFAYDGEEKSVRLNGLPEGLAAEYTGNTGTVAGEYTAEAEFIYDWKNYEKPEVEPCQWTIERSPVDISAVTWDYVDSFIFDGTEKRVSACNIPEGVTVSYSNVAASQAGTYVAAAELIPDDASNLIKARLENLTWRIDKGNYDMSHSYWDYEKPFVFDGTEHRVVMKGLPEGVIPSYRGNSATNAGKYKASVTFTVADSRNFNVPDAEEFDWTINKADYDMSGVSWNYNTEFRYSGRMFEVTLRGLPDGVRAVYKGNTAIGAGSYEASAELLPYDSDNYNQPSIKNCSWKIDKTDYDMSAVRWDYADNRVYNGREQNVLLEQLPNGVTAEYSGNEATDAGSYTAKATLIISDPANYNVPNVSECDWQIVRADYDMSGVVWDYEEGDFVYDGCRRSVSIRELPEGVTVEYRGNTGVKAGEYTATAVFDTINDNYKAPEPVSKTWNIARADYDMSRVSWDYRDGFIYDTTPKRIQLTGLPDGVRVRYEDNTATDAGSYTARAFFETDTTDYNVPESMSCEWSIGRADLDIRRLSWDYSQAFVYDGSEKTIRLTGVPEKLEVVYSGDTATTVGEYISHADLVPKDPSNYNKPFIKDCSWRIVKAEYDMSNARWDGEMESTYDGTEKTIFVTDLPSGVTPVYSGNTAVYAGRYSASVEFEYDSANYHKPVMRGCDWIIRRASYDMTKTCWIGDGDFVYDGTEKTMELAGLPDGVTPVYSGNTAVNAGEYCALADLEYDGHNYEKPYIGSCRWVIRKAELEIDRDAVRWNYSKPFVYDGTPKSIAFIEESQEVGFFDRLRGTSQEVRLVGIPEGVDVIYSGNTATDAGVYYAGAKLVSRDSENYSELELPKHRWEILKAPVDMSGVHWDYGTDFMYDGFEKSVNLAGVPENVVVKYSDNKAVNAGEYEAMAFVEAADPVNYEDPAPVSGCWWRINKASYDMSEVRWDYEGKMVYDGTEKTVRLLGLPDGVVVGSYVGNRAVDAGNYVAEAKLEYRNSENYEEPVAPELRWKIYRKKIDLSHVSWNYNEGTLFLYDDRPKEVSLVGVPDDAEIVYMDNRKINAGTYTARARLIYDSRNFEAEEIPDLIWTIEKASYDTADVCWTYSEPFIYDGTEKSVWLQGVPGSVNVRYRDNKATAAGTYTAKAYLTYDSDNYEEPEIPGTIVWEIVVKEKNKR